jgi:hypothetical protein
VALFETRYRLIDYLEIPRGEDVMAVFPLIRIGIWCCFSLQLSTGAHMDQEIAIESRETLQRRDLFHRRIECPGNQITQNNGPREIF